MLIFKKDDSTKAKNYRPVSVIPVVRQGFNTQQALVSLIEKWKAI